MKGIKQTLKNLFLLLLLFVMLLPATLNAQNDGGGMLGFGPASGNAEYSNREGLFDPSEGGYNIGTQHFGEDVNGGYNIGTQQFGQDLPLGSGWLVLTLAGAAYAFKKQKNNHKKTIS